MIQTTRAVGIVLKDSQVLVMKRINQGKVYFTFPGGGVEKGESIEEAVLRELAEETSIKVSIKQLLYIHEYEVSQQYYYLCEYISGIPQLAPDSEEKLESTPENVFEPQWIRVKSLPETLLYPLEIRDWLITNIAENFSAEFPKKAILDENTLRQK